MAPVFMALGGAVGVLFWRGGRGLRLEKEVHYQVVLLDTIMAQIGGLPADAPKAVKDGLWAKYQAVVEGDGAGSKLPSSKTIKVLTWGQPDSTLQSSPLLGEGNAEAQPAEGESE